MADVTNALLRRKPVGAFVTETGAETDGGELRRSVTLTELTALGDGATTPAAAAASGGTSCAPVLQARVVTLSIDAEAAHDRRVRQQASWLSRLPNDTLAGGCP